MTAGDYTLNLTLEGDTFDPFHEVISVPPDAEGIDFIATPTNVPHMSMNIAVSALITITVTSESGATLANEPVEFSTDYGTVLPASTVTDEQGVAAVVVVADDAPGTATVTMSAGSLTESVAVRFGAITDIPSLYLPLIER